MKFYLFLSAMLILDLTGIVAVKFWGIKNNNLYLLLGILAYAASAVPLAYSVKYEGAAITNIMWVALSAVCMTIIGYYGFKEIITPLQFIGIGIILIGLIIVQIK